MKSKSKIFALLILFSIFQICNMAQSNENEVSNQLLKFEKEYEEISIKAGLDNWNYYSKSQKVDTKIYKEKYRKFFSDPNLETLIEELENQSISNDTLRRRVEVYHNLLTGASVNFDKEILGLESSLEGWVEMGDGDEKKPSEEEMKSDVIKLIKLRNEKARQLGFDNYPELVLELTGLGSDWFYKTVNLIEQKTEKKYLSLVKELTGGKEEITFGEMRKGLIGYYMATAGIQVADSSEIELLRKTISGVGGKEINDFMIEKCDLPPGVGGQGIAVSIPDDFRIVIPEEFQFSDLMHEAGHGMQWSNMAVDYPVLKAYEWCLGSECSALSEGLAEIFSKIVNEETWKKKYSEHILKNDVDSNEVRKYLPLFLRFHIASFMFEHELYRNPDKEPKDIYDELYEKYLLIKEPVGRYRPLADIIYIAYPVYMHNYILGEMISWQILEKLREEFGSEYATNEGVFSYLQETLYKDGTSLPWNERLKRATGKYLSVEDYLNEHGM